VGRLEGISARYALAVAITIGIVAVAGCTRTGADPPGGGPAATAGTGSVDMRGAAVPASPPAASPSPKPAPPSPSTAALADGRSASYVKTVDVSKRTVTFDLIQLLTGADATRAWVKQHPDEPDGPPEGYLIINDNPKLLTLPFAANVTVKVIDLNSSDASALHQIKLADLPAHLGGERDAPLPYWLTVVHGQVTLVEEEYLA
jgi:hypothetical protein